MDSIFNVSMLDNMELNSTMSSILPFKTIPNSLKITVTCIAGLGVILNSLIIVSLSRPSLKTNLKLVVSLAFADLLTSVFHVMMPFVIDFQTPWTDKAKILVDSDVIQEHWNETSPAILNLLLKNGPNTIVTTWSRESEMVLDSKNMLIARSYNDSVERHHTLFDKSPILQKWLSSFYLMPNLACVLTMLGMSIALMIAVKYPLQCKDILSSCRGTKICVAIWLFSISVSMVTFLYTLVSDNNAQVAVRLSSVQDGIWILTMLIFVILTGLYAAILCIIKSSAHIHLTSSLKRIHTKAFVTSAVVLGTYAVCCLAFVWAKVLEHATFKSVSISNKIEDEILWMNFFQVSFVLNLVLDPLIYAFRLQEVANSVRQFLKMWSPCFSCR